MKELSFAYYIRQLIQIDLLNCYGAANFFELKTYSRPYHVKSAFLGAFNSGFPQFWKIKFKL